jgi:hypothetical protein
MGCLKIVILKVVHCGSLFWHLKNEFIKLLSGHSSNNPKVESNLNNFTQKFGSGSAQRGHPGIVVERKPL